jgi:hypothetical protein
VTDEDGDQPSRAACQPSCMRVSTRARSMR